MKRIKVLLAVCMLGLALTGCLKNVPKEGVEYLKNGQYNEAAEKFEQAIADGKKTGDAYRGLGIAKWELEDYEGARDAFQSALENGASKTGTLYNLIGSCEMNLGNPQAALNYYRLGLEQEDISGELKREMEYNIIAAYEQSGDWESAKVKLEHYISSYPDDENAKKELEFLGTR